jgi:hypothetical protein
MDIKGIEIIKEYLPNDWEEKCKELGALQRGRMIKTPEELLTLILLYMTEGESLQMTSAMMKLAGISVNKNAVHERIKSSWRWLSYLSKQVCQETGCLIEKPEWLEGKEVCLIDGSELSLKGSKGGNYYLHCMFNLFQFACRHLELTPKSEGEKAGIFEDIRAGDIVIGDRNYGNMKAMEHIKEKGAEFILRLKAGCFNIYDAEGNEINVLEYGKELTEWESMEIGCFYKQGKEFKPLKVCLMKKGKGEIEKAVKKQKRKASRLQRTLSARSFANNDFIVLATNVPYSPEKVFELYRARWQIEIVFKRLKSLFEFGNVPSKNENSVKAWFYGKLLLAGICEASIKRSRFPPNPKDGARGEHQYLE